jgi:glutathione S-transferase
MKPLLIVGSYLSPYVRKVLVCLELKGIAYEIDHIVPFFGDDRFSKLSPLRRIPVLVDRDLVLTDSTVICEYIEDKQPAPALLPGDIRDRARARWLEEFADTRMGDVFIWRIFYEAVINPFIWQRPRDKEKIARAVADELPEIMAHLERLSPASGFLFGGISIADISVAVFFRNLAWARVEIDRDRWPRTHGWVERTAGIPALAKITRIADTLAQTPLPQHRRVAAELGLPLTDSTVAAAAPRRGPMTVSNP